MKKIRNSAGVVIVVLVALLVNQGCEKYPEGPLVSIRSRTERVANVWKVDNYKVNDTDLTSLVADYTEVFTTDNNYSYQWSIIGGAGTWEFQNNDEEIRITGTENQSSVTLIILKLEEEQFWYYYMDGTDKKEFHMIQK